MNCKMEIVQCAREIKSGGGVSGVAYALEKEFRKKDIKTSRFTNDNVGISESKADRSFFRKKLSLLYDVVVYSIVGSIKLLWKIRREKEKVVFCHSDVLFGDVYINHGLHRAMLFASPAPFKMIVRNPIHLFLLLREWVRFNLLVPKRVVCFCQSDASELEKVYPKAKNKISLIPNGVNVDRFFPQHSSREKLRKDLDLSENDFLLIFVGHEFERKGLKVLLDAMPYMPANVRLAVVGGGGSHEVDKFKGMAERLCIDKRVSFLGTRSDIPDLMNAADLFVLPAFYETWALVGLEAMACGTPALMYPVGGITEYLHDGVNGYYIELDPKDVAEKVALLSEDYQKLEQFGLKAREKAMEFSWDKVASQYFLLAAEIYKEKIRSA